MRKKSILLLFIVVFCGGAMAQGGYQLPNPGFEQWDGNEESEPTHWNTFSSCDGSYASLASSNHHYRRNGHRPGGSGSYYLTIYTKSIIGVKANGNMTTGRIHAGSMTPSSSENHNYTQRSNSDHCQPFTATPDSMYVWVSFYAASSSSVAQVGAIIHGNSDYRSPNDDGDPSKYTAMAIARTNRTTTSASSMQWTQLKVPFKYYGTADPKYILVNLTTNNKAGEGDGGDSLSVDDIEFIYSAWLTNIKLRGQSIGGFNKSRLNYTMHVDDIYTLMPSDITYTTEVDDANVEVEVLQLDCDTAVEVVLTVTAEDGTTQKTYTIYATTGNPVSVETAEEKTFNVYPNPARGTITVETEGIVTFFDPQGREVMRTMCDGTTRIDISRLPRGLYYVKDERGRVKKVIHN